MIGLAGLWAYGVDNFMDVASNITIDQTTTFLTEPLIIAHMYTCIHDFYVLVAILQTVDRSLKHFHNILKHY